MRQHRNLQRFRVRAHQRVTRYEWEALVKQPSQEHAPISLDQGVTFRLADAETLVGAARQLCYHTLRLANSSGRVLR
jgi:alkylation response protein AidB-like acyl-CoA dehydrogenase